MMRYLFDTCVLVDYLRGRPAAVEFVRRVEGRPSVSVITAAELCAGVRDETESRRVEAVLTELSVRDVDLGIARLAGRFCRTYRRSHGIEIPDALIAATAQVHGIRLVTRNARHFPMLDHLVVPYQ